MAAKLSRFVLLLAALALPLGILAPAASAAPEDVRDAGGDVLSSPLYTDDLPARPEPAWRVGDFTRTTVSLGEDLVVTSRFRSLAATGHQDFTWMLRTSEDSQTWYVYLSVRPGKDNGTFTVIDPEANQPRCGSYALDRAGRTVTLALPAACLGHPSWVRVANGLTVVTSTRVYEDDARRDGDVRHGWKLGPKVTAS
jgi:hypothetical protein